MVVDLNCQLESHMFLRLAVDQRGEVRLGRERDPLRLLEANLRPPLLPQGQLFLQRGRHLVLRSKPRAVELLHVLLVLCFQLFQSTLT